MYYFVIIQTHRINSKLESKEKLRMVGLTPAVHLTSIA
jgi:hypothetical protein